MNLKGVEHLHWSSFHRVSVEPLFLWCPEFFFNVLKLTIWSVVCNRRRKEEMSTFSQKNFSLLCLNQHTKRPFIPMLAKRKVRKNVVSKECALSIMSLKSVLGDKIGMHAYFSTDVPSSVEKYFVSLLKNVSWSHDKYLRLFYKLVHDVC